ncbi:MerR family DNA-binding transcriptional regulator [Labrenzia sp. OB1]|uniref:MerR family transcriptional regulator n=1 Tax=Labrenzia sp. OB1 TaxID=1561204 RepID=UPI0007B2FF4B|nr:MerR family DNA-binding transcriptional regulator [Labrenzia sp. OB1]KZM48598.1 MerR family transcriptional regulator [Labrenzia sp. OB1]
MQRYFTITQLTQEFDITTRTLRFYEAQGLVSPSRRGRQRLYTPGDRTRIKLILRGKRLGFTLNDIREIIEMYASDPGETGQLRLLLDRIAARREELLEKQRDIELTLLELDEVESGARERICELATRLSPETV